MQVAAADSAATRQGSAALWYALFGGAAAWFAHLVASYLIVPLSCASESELYLHVLSIAMLAIAAGAAATGLVLYRAAQLNRSLDGGTRRHRTGFVAALGMAMSALFALVIIAQWFSVVAHNPCDSQPRLRDSPDAFVQPQERSADT